MKNLILSTLIAVGSMLMFMSCAEEENPADAFGNFEAEEIVISSEAQGKILHFNAEKGNKLKADELAAVIDTTQTLLKIQQLKAQKRAITAQNQNIMSQIEIQEQRRANTLVDKERIEKLFKDGAATQKQLDDINGGLEIIDKTINSIKTQYPAIFANLDAIETQVEQLEDIMNKSFVKNPIEGIVLENYIDKHELAFPGKPLYKIANMDEILLRFYLSGNQISKIKVSDKIKVFIDDNDGMKEYEAQVTWISPSAEFTPKIIQTKEERVNLVYAALAKVKNDGSIKIGMPGEVRFK